MLNREFLIPKGMEEHKREPRNTRNTRKGTTNDFVLNYFIELLCDFCALLWPSRSIFLATKERKGHKGEPRNTRNTRKGTANGHEWFF